MWLFDDRRAALLHQFLTRKWLRDVLKNAIQLHLMLDSKERHVRQHPQRVDRRWHRFGCEHLPIAYADPWSMREWRSQIRIDPVEDTTRCAAQTRITFVAGLSERVCRGLA